MSREELDSVSFDGSISNNGSQSLTVDTSRAEDILILIDDGNSDTAPPQYTLTERVETNEFGELQFYDEVTGETSRSWLDSAWGQSMEFEFTNTSGSSGNYRIVIKSYRSMD